MSTRMMMSDIRWFADYRPVCVIENELKKQLGAIDEYDYAEKLQKNAVKIFDQTTRKQPKVTVKST